MAFQSNAFQNDVTFSIAGFQVTVTISVRPDYRITWRVRRR